MVMSDNCYEMEKEGVGTWEEEYHPGYHYFGYY